MNIFKILANGDGSINEPNVSAFLGYLLNPYEDHGLGMEFLGRFLSLLEVDESEVEDENEPQIQETLYNVNDYSGYEYEIAFEAAFRNDDEFKGLDTETKRGKKEIVDIVIVQFNTTKRGESYIKDLLSDTREVARIILIENKIKDSAHNPLQIKNQFKATKAELAKILGKEIETKVKITSVYLTPNSLNDKVAKLKDDENFQFHHITWKDENASNVWKILKDILHDESLGNIEAINEYTKHTIISFVKFIENGFKSQVEQKKLESEGKYQKDISQNFDEYYSKYQNSLSDTSNELIKLFTEFVNLEYPELFTRHTKTHPVSVFKNESSGKLFSCTRIGKNVMFRFILRSDKSRELYDKLVVLFTSKGYSVIEDNWALGVKENLNLDILKTLFKEYYDIIKAIK